jgi:hypothetical protein
LTASPAFVFDLCNCTSPRLHSNKVMMKLYVGMNREPSRRVLLVARRHAGTIAYEICWEGRAEDLEELAFALLAKYLGDAEQARKVCASFARRMDVRLRTEFWTLRESEIAAAVAAVE